MNKVLLILITLFLFLSFQSNAQLKAKDPIHVTSAEEARWIIKVLKMELGMDAEQEVRSIKVFDNYIRRVSNAQKDLAADTVQLNQRLKLLVENRDATLIKTLGEEKEAAYKELIPKMKKKIAELKKQSGVK